MLRVETAVPLIRFPHRTPRAAERPIIFRPVPCLQVASRVATRGCACSPHQSTPSVLNQWARWEVPFGASSPQPTAKAGLGWRTLGLSALLLCSHDLCIALELTGSCALCHSFGELHISAESIRVATSGRGNWLFCSQVCSGAGHLS